MIATAIMIGLVVVAVVSGKGQIVGLIFGVPWLLLTLRAWSTGVHVDANGVKVVGFLLSKRVAWDSIDHFAVSPAGSSPYVGHIIRRDGRPPMPIVGLASAGRPKSKLERFRLQAQEPVDELNRVLGDWRDASGQQPSDSSTAS
jgi:hypothetical protein